MKSDETKELNCVLMAAYSCVLNTIDTGETWRATDKEAIQNSILSQCGKALQDSREKKDHRKEVSLRGPRNDRHPNAPTYEAFHQQQTEHCEEGSRIADPRDVP